MSLRQYGAPEKRDVTNLRLGTQSSGETGHGKTNALSLRIHCEWKVKRMRLHGMEVDDFEVVDATWDNKVDGELSWDFCAASLCMETGCEVDPDALREAFTRYFQERVGADPYGACPHCSGQLAPGRDENGPFVHCEDGCGYVARPVACSVESVSYF